MTALGIDIGAFHNFVLGAISHLHATLQKKIRKE